MRGLKPDGGIMKNAIALALPMAAMAWTPAANAQANEGNAEVVSIEAMLLYEQSGKMSVNIAGNAYFTAFNTSIGEGSAEESASDMVIRAVLKADEQVFARTPLIITIYDKKGNVRQRRTIDGTLLGKTTYRTMMVEDASCAGEITIEARMGASVKRENLNLMCGE